MKVSTRILGLLAVLAAGSAHADAREEVIAAFQKMMDDGSYKMVMIADGGGKGSRSEMTVELPSRFHIKNDGGEFIVLPEGTWMNAGGNWMKMPMNMSQMIEGFSAEAMEKAMASVQDVAYVGEDTVEGCDAKHYTYNARGTFMGVTTDSQTALWVCEDSGLPIRMVTNERGKSDKVTMVYDWDAPVDIRAPR